MKRQLKGTLVLVGSIGILSAGFLVRRAFAGGIPTTGVFTYSGTLQDASGNPALQTGSHNVAIKLYKAQTGGTSVCDTGAAQPLTVDAHGRFSLPIDACMATVKANPDLYAEVVVDGAALGRSKLGAVPYAVEAAHATAADTATNATTAATANAAGGGLASLVVPSGAVMAFDLAACPAGWSPFASAAGRVVVGATTGLGLEQQVGSDQVTLSVAQMPSHGHAPPSPANTFLIDQYPTLCPSSGVTAGCGGPGLCGGANGTSFCGNAPSTQPAGGSQPFDNRQASIALTYCKKN